MSGRTDDVPGLEDFVGLGRDRAVGEFEDDAGLHAGGVALVDHVLQGGRNEQLAIDRDEIVGGKSGDAVSPGKARDGSLPLGRKQLADVETRRAMDRALRVGDRHDAVPVAGKQPRDVLAGIAEALDRHP